MSDRASPPHSLRSLADSLLKPVRDLLDERLPDGVGYWHTTGSICLFLVGLQGVTGILMALYYTPSPDAAWESVRFVDDEVMFGRIVHGLHHWGSSAFVVMAVVHMLRVFAFGAYKGDRRWTWVVGVALLGVVLAFGFTGYLLPWDMKAYFGTKVGANIMSSVPVVGESLKKLALGGERIGELTLPRFYALHVLVLPLTLLALVLLHLKLVRLYGITPPWRRVGEELKGETVFFPGQALRDIAMVSLVFVLLLVLAGGPGAGLGAKADPASTTYAPHPEWYFLGLQQLLRYFPGKTQIIATVIIPGGFFLFLLLVPFVDRNPERALRKRPVAVMLCTTLLVAVVGLTYEGRLQLRIERRVLAELQIESLADQVARLKKEANEDADLEGKGEAGMSLTLTEFVVGGKGLEFDRATIDYGARIYEGLKCGQCHNTAETGHGDNMPPSLAFAGNRFQPGWTISYMRDVPRRRYEKKYRRPIMRMPDYRMKPNELRGIAAYLSSLTRPELFEKEAGEFETATEEQIKQGRELFELEACLHCHVLNGKGKTRGPDLTGAGSRLKAPFMFQMIKNPQSLVPGGEMEDSFMNDNEILALTLYLMTQRDG